MVFVFTLVDKQDIDIWLWHQSKAQAITFGLFTLKVKVNQPPNLALGKLFLQNTQIQIPNIFLKRVG